MGLLLPPSYQLLAKTELHTNTNSNMLTATILHTNAVPG
jgi:hypothetical protein